MSKEKNYDDKQIGRNIKAIRNANGMNTLDFATRLGITDSTLEKIEHGTRHATDLTIQNISRYSGFSFSDIKFGDLTYLKKGELKWDDSFSYSEICDDEMARWNIEIFKIEFPIIETDEAMKSDSFKKGIEIVKEKIQALSFENSECIQAINLFLNSRRLEGVDEVSCVNVLSCFAYLYLKMVLISIDESGADKLMKSKMKSMTDFYYSVNNNINEALKNKNKQIFLEHYNSILTNQMNAVTKNSKYSDFSYYYLWLRYSLGMLDDEIVRLNENQMKVFSESMFDCLWKMGNKYALAFHDYILECEKE